jgi:hypothetical protein
MTELPLKIPQANEEKLVISADSAHKAENIDLVGEDEPAKEIPDSSFPELDELEKEVGEYEEYDDFGALKEPPVASPWALPVKLQERVIAKARLKLYSSEGTTVLHGYSSDMIVGSNASRIRFLLKRADLPRVLRLYVTHGSRASGKSMKNETKNLIKYLGYSMAKKPIRGIKEKKSFDHIKDVGIRISEIKLQIQNGEPSYFRSSWEYLGQGGKTVPSWKLGGLVIEATGENEFVWVDVSYES